MLDVAIAGGGIAGLVCALELSRKGISFQIFEASDGVGGRIRTDYFKEFLLDRGFQVLLTAYPEANRYLNYDALELKNFRAGALIHVGNHVHELLDPRRELSAILESTFAPIGTLGDKVRTVRLATKLHGKSIEEIFDSPELTTLAYLQQQGFSEEIIERFFRPFFGGIFLERGLETSSRKFEFVFSMFGEGFAAIPAAGMQAIPEQLTAQLPAGCVRTGTSVAKVKSDSVELASGEVIPARAVVVAVDPQNVNRLLPEIPAPPMVGTTCFYFAAERAPTDKQLLILNGDGIGLVNHLAVMSNIAPSYAPAGASLISVTILGVPSVGEAFGEQVSKWFLLRKYEIRHALPMQSPIFGGLRPLDPVMNGVVVAGDHRQGASTNGAMRSGRIAAEAVLARLGVSNAAD